MTLIIADRVKETSVTTGTGALTLAGAMTAYQSFASKCTVGDTFYYALQAVDAGGAATGEWECGLGTYSATNTLTRTTVTSSSNSGAVVNLSAGTKQVFLSMPAVQVAWARERLTADRTYYVATTGSDSNNGLVVGTPFLTVQKAIDVVSNNLDIGIFNVVIQLANGTYPNGTIFKTPIGSGSVTIKGDTSNPSNVVFSGAGACITASETTPVKRAITGVKLTSSTYAGLMADRLASLFFGRVDFGACSVYHMTANGGAVLTAENNYTISGAATVHCFIEQASICILHGRTVTITGTPTLTYGFAISRQGSMISAYGMTFVGSSTGPKYEVQLNGVVFVDGASTSYLPGSIAGAVYSGGQYG